MLRLVKLTVKKLQNYLKYLTHKLIRWDKKLVDIEHRILRSIWNDSRIHYVVNCASISCPNLVKDVYTKDNTKRLLHQGAIDYINHHRGVKVKGDRALLSSIYKWYKVDFGGSEKTLLQHLKKYANNKLKQQLTQVSNFSYSYNWDLNIEN